MATPEFTDEELLRAAYGGPKAPDGTYQETLENTSLYYVNTISIQPLSDRGDVWIELCSNDIEQAREWAIATDANSSVHRTLKGERETEKFFEFDYRDVIAGQPWSLLTRVHKCSYFEPTLDHLSPEYEFGGFSEAVLGLLHGPATLEAIQEFVEYTWFTDSYNIGGSRLLASVATEELDSLIVDLYTTVFVGGDWGLCDSVTLMKVTYSLDRVSGEVCVFQESIRTVQGECHPEPNIEP